MFVFIFLCQTIIPHFFFIFIYISSTLYFISTFPFRFPFPILPYFPFLFLSYFPFLFLALPIFLSFPFSFSFPFHISFPFSLSFPFRFPSGYPFLWGSFARPFFSISFHFNYTLHHLVSTILRHRL